MNIAIIGSGIGGLSSAIRLVKAGHSVSIFERNTILQQLLLIRR